MVVVVVVKSVGTEGNLSVLRGLLRRGWFLLSVLRGLILLEEGFFLRCVVFAGRRTYFLYAVFIALYEQEEKTVSALWDILFFRTFWRGDCCTFHRYVVVCAIVYVIAAFVRIAASSKLNVCRFRKYSSGVLTGGEMSRGSRIRSLLSYVRDLSFCAHSPPSLHPLFHRRM